MEHTGKPRRLLIAFGLLVFAYALLSKWEKWPAGTLLLIASSVIMWIGALVHVFRREREALSASAMAAFVTYTVFRLLYWSGAPFVCGAALVLAGFAIVRWWLQGRSRVGWPVLPGIAFVCTLALMAVPVHALYHYMMFVTPGAQRFLHTGTGSWYRYSWFLYQDGQYSKSAAMIDSAMVEVTNHKARTGEDGEWLLVQLRAARATIEARQWDAFKVLHAREEALK